MVVKTTFYAVFILPILTPPLTPGKVIYPLLISSLDNKKYYDYFYTLNNHTKEVAKILQPDIISILNFNKKLKHNQIYTTQPLFPNRKYFSNIIVRRALLLGYGTKITPYHLINGYKKMLLSKNGKYLEDFMQNNATKYYNLVQKNIGLVGGLSRGVKNGRYTNGKHMSLVGLYKTNKNKYLTFIFIEFNELAKGKKSSDNIWIFQSIQKSLDSKGVYR